MKYLSFVWRSCVLGLVFLFVDIRGEVCERKGLDRSRFIMEE